MVKVTQLEGTMLSGILTCGPSGTMLGIKKESRVGPMMKLKDLGHDMLGRRQCGDW